METNAKTTDGAERHPPLLAFPPPSSSQAPSHDSQRWRLKSAGRCGGGVGGWVGGEGEVTKNNHGGLQSLEDPHLRVSEAGAGIKGGAHAVRC
jgi:hypothetical protein